MAVVQTKTAGGDLFGGTTSAQLAFDAPTGAGNLVVVCFTQRSFEGIVSISDGTNTYDLADGTDGGTDGVVSVIYYKVPAGSIQTITVTLIAGSTNHASITLIEEGDPQASPLETSTKATTGPGATSHSSGNITTTTATTLLVGCIGSNSAAPAHTETATGFTNLRADGNSCVGYREVTATGTYAYTSTSGGCDAIAVIAAFKVNAAGGGSTPAPSVGALTLTGAVSSLGFTILMPDEA